MHRKFILIAIGFVLVIFSWYSLSFAGPAPAFSDGEQYGYLPVVINPAKDSVWQSYPSPTDSLLEDVSMVSADDGWVVGSGGTFLHWNGSAWSEFDPVAYGNYLSVSMSSATGGWAVGWDGLIARWDGSSWENFAIAPGGKILFSVDTVAADDAWAVGNGGTIMHWNGSSWTIVPSPVNAQLYGVTMVSANEGWIAGYDGNYGIILHWNGSQWIKETVPAAPRLFNVAMPTATTAWAVGENGVILNWENGTWSHWSNPKNSSDSVGNIIWFTDVAMPSADLGWAVGGYVDSSILVQWDGTKWFTVDNPAKEWLRSIDMVSDVEGWAVGDNGTIIHFAPEA